MEHAFGAASAASGKNEPPSIEVLFRAKEGAGVQNKLDAIPTPKWVRKRTGENGSYTASIFDKAVRDLVQKNTDAGVVTVLVFDHYAGHKIPDDAADLLLVCIYIGAGCTDLIQPCDSHAHADFSGRIRDIEITQQAASVLAQIAATSGRSWRMPISTREDALLRVIDAWRGVDHKKCGEAFAANGMLPGVSSQFVGRRIKDEHEQAVAEVLPAVRSRAKEVAQAHGSGPGVSNRPTRGGVQALQELADRYKNLGEPGSDLDRLEVFLCFVRVRCFWSYYAATSLSNVNSTTQCQHR